MARRNPPLHTYYRVWWALGGYKHYDEPPSRHERHPDPKRDLDRPVRIDKIQIVWEDVDVENEVHQARRDRAVAASAAKRKGKKK